MPGKFFKGIDSQDPSDSKSNWLQVDIFRFCFHSFQMYSLDPSKTIGKFCEALNVNRLFLNWTGWFAIDRRFFPDIDASTSNPLLSRI